jgi:hypothetical protein
VTTNAHYVPKAEHPAAAATKKHGVTARTTRAPSATAAAQRVTAQGIARADAPYQYGNTELFGGDLARPPHFRFTAIRQDNDPVELAHVESASWDDVNAILTGQVTVRDPIFGAGSDFTLGQGDQIVCEVTSPTGVFGELWTMRCYEPQLAVNDRQRQFRLVNDLDLLRQSEGNFLYGATSSKIPTGLKKKAGGWKGDEIIKDVCDQFKIPVSIQATFTFKRAKWVWKRASPLEVIRTCLLAEKRHTGRRMVVRFDAGTLYILPLQRSVQLRALGPTLIDASFRSLLPPEFASAATLHGLVEYSYGQDPKGKEKHKPQKMHVYMESTASVSRFGYVHRVLFSPDSKTDAALKEEAAAYLAAAAKPLRRLTLTLPGIPRLRRGDAVQLAIGDDSLWRQIVFVDQISHQLSTAGYTMQVTCIFDDPYIDRRQQSILFRLKGTHDEAVGDRTKTKGPLWYVPKNNKGDATGTPGSGATARYG